MRRITLFILSIMMIGCIGCGTRGLTKFYVNGETSTDSYVHSVKFREKGVAFPMESILVLLGAEHVENDLRLNDKYFIFDYEHRMVFLEDENGRSDYLKKLDYPNRYKRWNETNSLLPSEDCLDNDEKYISWGTKVVIIDDQSLINILGDIGIELQVDVDRENEVVYLRING